jgi:hypothetical protein
VAVLDQEIRTYKIAMNDIDKLISRIEGGKLSNEDKQTIIDMLNTIIKGFCGMPSKEVLKWLKRIEKAKQKKDNTPPSSSDSSKESTEETQEETEVEVEVEAEAEAEEKQGFSGQNPDDEENPPESHQSSEADKASTTKESSNRDNHGRVAAKDCENAIQVFHQMNGLNAGDSCPACITGTVYKYASEPILSFQASTPIEVVSEHIEKCRCGSCQQIFSAIDPEILNRNSIGRFSLEAVATLANMRYLNGMPFYRLEQILSEKEIKVSDSGMWDSVKGGYGRLMPLWNEFKKEVANSDNLASDDGSSRVVSLQMDIKSEQKEAIKNKKNPDKVRSGINTTCVIAGTDHGNLILFLTGRHHCGESLGSLLQEHRVTLNSFNFMSDAASTHTQLINDYLEVIKTANCLQHARDRFKQENKNFPIEAGIILGYISEVFAIERGVKQANVSNKIRLQVHKSLSLPIMNDLKQYAQSLIDQKIVEPNSNMGKYINYLKNHWSKLTAFTRIEGALIDNNACERAVKIIKRYLKNSLSYQSEEGAKVGDLFMSFGVTCKAFGISPIEYFTECMRFHEKLAENPSRFMPWNFNETIAELRADPLIPPWQFENYHRPKKVEISHSYIYRNDDAPMQWAH